MTKAGDWFHRAKGAVTHRMRFGDRYVLWTSGGLGLGNFLYLWLRAHIAQEAGQDYRVLLTPPMRRWVDEFPAVEELLVDRSDVRFVDRRGWDHSDLGQRFGVDFTRAQLYSFINDRLLTSPALRDLGAGGAVINIRRGDYYSNPEFAGRFGMDIESYVQKALTLVDVDSVTVVSDDPEWCRSHLQLPSPSFEVTDPIANLRAIVEAGTLIGTNSTFSYWGGYIGDTIHKERTVVMPEFHARTLPGGRAHQLDPQWLQVAAEDCLGLGS